MATHAGQDRWTFTQVFSVAGPLVVAGAMALALDHAIYVASGGMWSFLSTFLLPLWALALVSSLAALFALLAVIPPAAVSLFFIAASALRRLAFRLL